MLTFERCLLCNAPLSDQFSWRHLICNLFPPTICTNCEGNFELNTENDLVTSLFTYNEAMRDYIHRYKFMHDVILAHVFRQQLANALANETRLVVPIPMHPVNKKKRTFAHIDELLKAAAIPFEHKLDKITTATQLGKTRAERLQHSQLFQVNSPVNGLKIILLDDIYTTGATIQQAKKQLYVAGAKEVKALTLIHHKY